MESIFQACIQLLVGAQVFSAVLALGGSAKEKTAHGQLMIPACHQLPVAFCGQYPYLKFSEQCRFYMHVCLCGIRGYTGFYREHHQVFPRNTSLGRGEGGERSGLHCCAILPSLLLLEVTLVTSGS